MMLNTVVLAGTVGADQAGDGSLGNTNRNIVENLEPTGG